MYRNQDDYISKYRTVIEYFDAVKIGLTATPALHTTEIFGRPVYTYSYREAVIDGYLVDHDAPHDIHTKLRDSGIQYKKGDTLAIFDSNTGEVINSAELEDDMKFEVDSFNKKIIVPNFNKAVFEEIAMDFDPDGEGKTLIYAVDDSHADMIVQILKEIYSKYGVDNDTVMKITGSIEGGNKKKILEAIKRFKNESNPKVVVTVDLLTTGIDVPEITNLVFMRRIKSRILFEQMLGRAARLCLSINKTHFEIYDPVGVYETLEPVSNMKPVAANPNTAFKDLIDGLKVLEKDKLSNQITALIAKLQRKSKRVSIKALSQFKYLTHGKSPEEAAGFLKSSPTDEAVRFVLEHEEAFDVLDNDRVHIKRPVIIDDREDEVVSHERGYAGASKPEDYIEEFKNFITTHLNKIAALNIVCTKPAELTRENLKQLKIELDRHNFTEKQLNTAWNEMTNQDIVVDINLYFLSISGRKSSFISEIFPPRQLEKNSIENTSTDSQEKKYEINESYTIGKKVTVTGCGDGRIIKSGMINNAVMGVCQEITVAFDSGKVISFGLDVLIDHDLIRPI